MNFRVRDLLAREAVLLWRGSQEQRSVGLLRGPENQRGSELRSGKLFEQKEAEGDKESIPRYNVGLFVYLRHSTHPFSFLLFLVIFFLFFWVSLGFVEILIETLLLLMWSLNLF